VQGPQATVWLVGVLHLATAEERRAYPRYLGFYEASRQIYFETAPGAWTTLTARRLLKHRGALARSTTLRSQVAPETWSLVQESARRDPANFPDITGLRPWLASMEVEKAAYRAAGLTADAGLENHLLALASGDRKPVGALETPAEQIDPIATLPAKDQEAALLQSLRDYAIGYPSLESARRAWIAGDLDAMRRALRVSPGQPLTAMQRALIDERNALWIAKIASLAMGREDTLVVVGVKHLVTPEIGLPEQLAGRGFPVRRVD